MKVIEDHRTIDAQCNECLKVHESYSGSIVNDESQFSEYLISLDPQHSNRFLLFIKINRETDYIVCGLLVSLEDQAILTYKDKYPLVVDGFDWLLETLPRVEVLEKGFDEVVFGIFKEVLIKNDSRISGVLKKWADQ
ncbi:hypothetical protein GCM10008090_25790 [Arenicella chitinivorans]|uniref:Uncharacterized protein n=1 Tax=Arenicella chitinivorans TaxID=1329800 RepID=A0A918RXP1_9GAMM|nr:hypothetical protein [Arenicella chitinivorans]GHA15076.1 hypothetical protein GCM10008090_25790 [Arenicella chitinivorans]